MGYLENFIKTKVREIKITPLCRNLTKWGLEQEKDEYLILFILDELIKRMERPDTKKAIYQYVKELKEAKTKSLLEKTVIWIGEQTNSVNVSDATDALYKEIVHSLQEMKNSEHVLHKWIHAKLIEIISQPDDEIPWADEIEKWKIAWIDRIELTEILGHFAEKFIEKISTSTHNHLLEWGYSQANQHWMRFKSNDEMQQWLEIRIKQAVIELVENEHHLIGTLVQEVLNTFTDEDLNRFIEDKAGGDLQWIRINGCIVGAIVGLIMFIFLHYFYDPHVVPVMQAWLYGR